MKPILLAPETRVRLSKVAGMLGSTFDGEALNAGRTLESLLRAEGTSLGDLLERLAELEEQPSSKPKPAPPRSVYSRRWQALARDCLLFPQHFNEREASFLDDMRVRRDEPTQPQWQWLRNLYARLEAKEGANA